MTDKVPLPRIEYDPESETTTTRTCVADTVDEITEHFTGHGIEPGEYDAILNLLERRVYQNVDFSQLNPDESLAVVLEPNLSTLFDELEEREIHPTQIQASPNRLETLKHCASVSQRPIAIKRIHEESLEPEFPIAIVATSTRRKPASNEASIAKDAHIWFAKDNEDLSRRYKKEMQGRKALLLLRFENQEVPVHSFEEILTYKDMPWNDIKDKKGGKQSDQQITEAAGKLSLEMRFASNDPNFWFTQYKENSRDKIGYPRNDERESQAKHASDIVGRHAVTAEKLDDILKVAALAIQQSNPHMQLKDIKDEVVNIKKELQNQEEKEEESNAKNKNYVLLPDLDGKLHGHVFFGRT